MINAINSGRTFPPSVFKTLLPSPVGSHNFGVLSFRKLSASSSSAACNRQPDQENMEREKSEDQSMTQNPNEKTGDIMSHSFGEGYATRSDEEGFGGIYGGNQSLPKTDEDADTIDESHPEYDKSQGSEVKEKEKARHQTNANG